MYSFAYVIGLLLEERASRTFFRFAYSLSLVPSYQQLVFSVIQPVFFFTFYC